MAIEWIESPDREQLAEAVAKTIATRLSHALDADGAASLVVSGGSTPAPVFQRLAKMDLNWEKMAVTLADERWVPPGHTDSNEALVRRTLLTGHAAAARFVPLYRDGVDPESAVPPVSEDLRGMAQPYTVIVLGMGADGHTASLFPDAPDVQAALADTQAAELVIMRPPSQALTRISLTRRALMSASHRLLHITGVDKRVVLEAAVGGTLAAADGHPLPIARFFNDSGEGMPVYWCE